MLAGTSKSELGTDIVCDLLIESRGLNLTVWCETYEKGRSIRGDLHVISLKENL